MAKKPEYNYKSLQTEYGKMPGGGYLGISDVGEGCVYYRE